MVPDTVYVVYGYKENGDINGLEVHAIRSNADLVSNTLTANGHEDVKVLQLEVKKDAGTAKATATAKSSKKTKSAEPEDDMTDGDDGMEEEAPAPKKAAAKKTKDDSRKQIPNGIPGAFDGVKVLFTGTMKGDRKTMEATAIKYGGTIVTKVQDADYIILGTRPGPKKLEEINQYQIETISESEFLEMLQTGVSEEKLDNIQERAELAAEEAEAAGEPVKKKAKK